MSNRRHFLSCLLGVPLIPIATLIPSKPAPIDVTSVVGEYGPELYIPWAEHTMFHINVNVLPGVAKKVDDSLSKVLSDAAARLERIR